MSDNIESLQKEGRIFPPSADFASAHVKSMDEYEAIYKRSIEEPENWWSRARRRTRGQEPWDTVLDWSEPPFAKWFVGGKLNAAENCLDRHVAAGSGRTGRPPLGRRARRQAGRHLRRAARRHLSLRQRHERTWYRATTASSSTCPWCPRPSWPCSPAPGSARCTRWSSAPRRLHQGPMEDSEAKAVITADGGCAAGLHSFRSRSSADEALESYPRLETVFVLHRAARMTSP